MKHEAVLKAIRETKCGRGDLVLVLIDSRKPIQECLEKEHACDDLEAETGARVLTVLNDLPIVVTGPEQLDRIGLRIVNRRPAACPDQERR